MIRALMEALVILVLGGICVAISIAEITHRAEGKTIRTDLMPTVYELTDQEFFDQRCAPYDIPKSVCDDVTAYHSYGRIYVREGFRGTSIYEAGVMLHEMTHFYQFQTGVLQPYIEDEACMGPIEKTAYDVQRAYLESSGKSIGPPDDPEYNYFPGPLNHMMQTTCPWYQ